jgi:hypothetical protein
MTLRKGQGDCSQNNDENFECSNHGFELRKNAVIVSSLVNPKHDNLCSRNPRRHKISAHKAELMCLLVFFFSSLKFNYKETQLLRLY